MKNQRVEDYKSAIEEFYEQHNGKIQMFLILITIIIATFSGMTFNEIEPIIVTLLTLACVELLSLSLKDSIQQRKLNRILRRGEIKDGKFFRVADFDLQRFFKKTEKMFFISGIALNNFFETYGMRVEKLLVKGKKVCVLFCDYHNFDKQAELYFGSEANTQDAVRMMKGMQYQAIMRLEKIKDIERYIRSGLLEIRFSNTTFSTSFVAHDILTNKNEEPRVSKETSKIKVSFYLYAIDKAEKKNPNVLVDNKYLREWYDVFKHSLANQWRDAHKIHNLDELRNIRNDLMN